MKKHILVVLGLLLMVASPMQAGAFESAVKTPGDDNRLVSLARLQTLYSWVLDLLVAYRATDLEIRKFGRSSADALKAATLFEAKTQAAMSDLESKLTGDDTNNAHVVEQARQLIEPALNELTAFFASSFKPRQ